jgi:hypothetical protein
MVLKANWLRIISINPSSWIYLLASTRYIIAEGDKTGGSGANFIVVWKSENKVNPPIIEGVMIGTRSGQEISFVSRGQSLKLEE